MRKKSILRRRKSPTEIAVHRFRIKFGMTKSHKSTSFRTRFGIYILNPIQMLKQSDFVNEFGFSMTEARHSELRFGIYMMKQSDLVNEFEFSMTGFFYLAFPAPQVGCFGVPLSLHC